MKNALILVAHPQLAQSHFNRLLVDAAQTLPKVTVRDLYALYPTFDIDVPAEQEALRTHDVIVMQFPFYWYSSPAILKKWQDDVLTWGFAHGDNGTALKGKRLICAITTGSPNEMYRSGERHNYTVAEFLRPFEQTAVYCQMEFAPPYIIQGSARVPEEAMKKAVKSYSERLAAETRGLP